jgi:CubicO group peptidase (beta-lactamase class C family)
MRIKRLVFFTIWAFFVPIICRAQVSAPDLSACNEVKDSIVTKYNRQDFRGIYLMSDTSFSIKISEQQLVGFLKNNFSTGKIMASEIYKTSAKEQQYLLQCQARNMILILGLTANKKISTFGLAAYPNILRDVAIVPSNNPLKSELDLAVDSIAKEYFRFPHAVSLSVGIIKNGQPSNYHYGETKRGNGKLPDLKTGYQIASVSKTFTATLLAQAVLDGKLGLNDDIRKYLPGEYPNLQYNGQLIRIVELANHTSGLPAIPDNYASQPLFDPLNTLAHYTADLFDEALHKVKIEYAPGSRFFYSNMGIDLLGYILEQVYQKSYSELLKKYITDPFGMVDTKVKLTPKDKNEMALPYGNSGWEVPFWSSEILPGAGGITSTTGDMLVYLANQISERNKAVKLTHQPTANSTGLAWGVRTINGVRDMQHSGGGVGYRSNISFYPELKSGAVILINNDSDSEVMNRLVIAIQNLLKTPN